MKQCGIRFLSDTEKWKSSIVRKVHNSNYPKKCFQWSWNKKVGALDEPGLILDEGTLVLGPGGTSDTRPGVDPCTPLVGCWQGLASCHSASCFGQEF